MNTTEQTPTLINVVVIREQVISENWLFAPSDNNSSKAEAKFIELIQADLKEPLDEDIKTDYLDDGYYEFANGNGSICITWPEVIH